MYILQHETQRDIIVGWHLETGEHGLFTHTAQMAVFFKEQEVERKGIDVSNLTVEQI